MPFQKQNMLYTKLNEPVLPRNLVERIRLFVPLNMGIKRRFARVCAQAGHGKTTRISNWINRIVASQDKEPSSLCAYTANGLMRQFESQCRMRISNRVGMPSGYLS